MAEVIGLVRSFYSSRRAVLSPTELRSIGPICSALESLNYKRALLLTDQVLKRSPGDVSALALKAFALSVSSKPIPSSTQQDILKVVEAVRTLETGAALRDADVLMILSHVLRGIDRGEMALELLAKATQLHPDNEELSLEAFTQYMRSNDCKSAQLISAKMSKRFMDDRYFWWSIMSTILQVRDLANSQGELLLSLVERQLSHRFSSSSTETPAQKPLSASYASVDEIHVITRFLELRAQYAAFKADSPSTSISTSSSSPALILPSLPPSDAPISPAKALLAHFSSAEADKWCEQNLGLDLWRREVVLAYGSVEGGEWKKSWERLKAALEKGDINWHTMLYLIRAALAIAADSLSTSTESPSPSPEGLDLLSQTRQLFRSLAADSPKAKVERGYLLGQLEIARGLRSRGWEEVDDFLALVKEYFERFGTKACCFDDLHPYLEVMSDKETSALGEILVKASDEGLTTVAAATKVINACKILRLLSDERTEAEQEKAEAEKHIKRYFNALPLGKDLPPTELQPADDFALLAGQAYVSAFGLSHDRSYLERALVVLEHVLLRSKYKYQVRILTINILRLLGASSAALAHYRIFGVKNVQYDTLSHIVMARASTFAIESGKDVGVFDVALATSTWYTSGQREAREMVVKAFNTNALSKIEDFSEFRHRLSNSLQDGLTTLETLRMRVLRGVLDPATTEEAVQTLERLSKTSADSYSDNRDYKTLPNYQSKNSRHIWQQTELGERLDADWLHTMASTYLRFFAPASKVPTCDAPRSMTQAEAALLSFSRFAQVALVAPLDQAAEAEQAALAFFKDQAERFAATVDDAKSLPWEVLQVAEVTLEAFTLVELGINQRLGELAATKAVHQAKHSKRLRAFRNSARDLVKPVGAKMTAYGKKVGKDRPKIVAAVADLQAFPALDEDRITNVAHALVESRRSAAEALGSAMHRKTVK
ncbi:actin cytoskeleton organization protein [Rhodotorula toruloides]|uniref:Actin cytoskeleton organization protein n=1 Tax=Rhodotorula toruloides TaxID=5286 RepID=A0A511KGV1_RHOTO|nr:actin cytoskeleton organization protein [Rhodotorula toruloides]